MEPRTYKVTLTASSPLLMHYDDVNAADALAAWRTAPANQKYKKTGDDRSPAWTWLSYMYHDGSVIGIPGANLMKCMMEAGALVPVPGGRSGKTFKSQSQSGMQIQEEMWPLLVDGKKIPMSKLAALLTERDFEKHQEVARALGIDLFVKRASIGNTKHVRVRPKFHRWEASGTVVVWDDKISIVVVQDLFSLGGSYKGICDWRPSSKMSPGPFGRFSAKVSEN